MAAKQGFLSLLSDTFKGLVLNPSQLSRDPNSATLCSNVEKAPNGKLTVRKGTRNTFFQNGPVVNPFMALFPVTYSYHDTTTGATVEELLALGMAMDSSYAKQTVRLNSVFEDFIDVTYSGTGSGRIVVKPETNSTSPNRWRAIAYANGVQVYSATWDSAAIFGQGNLKDFVVAIDALANFSVSYAIGNTAKYTFLEAIFGGGLDVTIANGATESFIYYSISEIGTLLDAPLSFTHANFVLPTFHNFANVLDIAYGTYLQKYDGMSIYKSGLPQATLVSVADAAGGSTFATGEKYIYKAVYYRVDNRGNIIEGEDSDDTLAVASHTMGSTKDILVTLNNIVLANNYGARSAKVNGAQVGVNTITVFNTISLLPGEKAYFKDQSTGQYVTRNIVSTPTTTTIVIDGAPVNVSANQIISNNTRIQIYRTRNGDTIFNLIEEIPNDASQATTAYTDSTADASVGREFLIQTRKHSLPPKCYFIGDHQGLRVCAGDPDNPNRVSWSLYDDSEAFPLESNNTDIQGGGLGALTGFGTVDENGLAVFKESGYALVDGSLDDLSFQIINKADTGIGCLSFRTLSNIGESGALVGLSFSGPFIFNNRVPQLALSENIRPLFRQPETAQINGTPVPNSSWTDLITQALSTDVKRVLKRAVAINDRLNFKYHLFIPSEIGVPGQVKVSYPVSSKYLVYDYDPSNLFWTEYTFYNRYRSLTVNNAGRNVAPNCGFALFKNKIWFGMQSYRDSTHIDALLFRFNDGETKYDYSEGAYPVYMDIHYTPFTRAPGSASTFFKPLFVMIYRFLSSFLNDPVVTPDFGDDFSLTVKTVKDYREYAGTSFSTDSSRILDAASGTTSLKVKCVTDKARAYQIQISNEDAVIDAYEVPSIDNVEFIYSMPYDKQTKDPNK